MSKLNTGAGKYSWGRQETLLIAKIRNPNDKLVNYKDIKEALKKKKKEPC